MTKPHPLTDDMIEDIAYETIQSDESVRTGGLGVPAHHDGRVVLRYADMRAAYDLAIEHVYETWNRLFDEAESAIPYGRDSTICWRFSRELEAMRPQEDN